MVGVEAVLVPVLLLERELCHRHGRKGYLEVMCLYKCAPASTIRKLYLVSGFPEAVE